MKLQALTTGSAGTDAGRDVTGHVAASGEEESFFPHAHVAILDEDVLDDECFEPDGVNEVVRNCGLWNPDREL